MDLAGRNVVVFGLGGSGRAAARLAVEKGARVLGVERKTDVPPIEGARLALGEPHPIEAFAAADLVVVSPGIPASAAPIRAALDAGVPVLGELAFAASFLDQPVIAITGTNGKSTVTHFTGQLLAAAGFRPFAGGNLGRPLSEAAFAENAGAFDVLAVEVSSYQMEFPGTFHPRIAAILNLTPDHLARHGTMEGYAAAKCRIFQQMDDRDVAMIPHDPVLVAAADAVGRGSRAWIGATADRRSAASRPLPLDGPGVLRDGDTVRVRLPGAQADYDLGSFGVPGDHNRDNAALAAAFVTFLGGDPARIQQGLGALEALPHRMQVVAEQGGVTWIDDSKATNVAAVLVGLAGLRRSGVLLLGGEAKGDPFADLAAHLGPWKVVTFGGSGDRIADELAAVGVIAHRTAWLADAVHQARTLAAPGDVVLLSPGCASFDEFRNFEHRGQVFAALANSGATP